MMSRRFKNVIGLMALWLLSACAVQNGSDARIPSDGNDCFWANSIHDWKALNDQTLIVWSPGRHCAYRVDLAHRCTGLRFTEDLGFSDRDGRICSYGGDAVIVPGPTGGRCSIAAIKRLTPEGLERLLPDRENTDGDQSMDSECEDKAQDLNQ